MGELMRAGTSDRRGPVLSQNCPCSATKRSLIPAKNSLISYVGNSELTHWIFEVFPGSGCRQEAHFPKFPCIFPVTREFRAETGSAQTASATIQTYYSLKFLQKHILLHLFRSLDDRNLVILVSTETISSNKSPEVGPSLRARNSFPQNQAKHLAETFRQWAETGS